MEGENAMVDTEPQPWYLKSKFPVFWPKCEALTMPEEQFEEYLARIQKHGLKGSSPVEAPQKAGFEAGVDAGRADDDTYTLISEQPSTTVEIRQLLGGMDVDTDTDTVSMETSEGEASGHDEVSPAADARGQSAFMTGLLSHGNPTQTDASHLATENKMLTENGDVAYRSTNSALVDLFAELEDVVSGPRLLELLDAAWAEDPLATLKLAFNARSIHLGKSSRHAFYRCAGWLATYHPLTLVKNLQWLSRPVIERKKASGAAAQKDDQTEDLDAVVVEDESDPARFDVRHGVAHGYWKDLLNILALSANGCLTVLSDPREVLNVENEKAGPVRSKEEKREAQRRMHRNAIELFTTNPTHQALHLTVARLFAAQLKSDLTLLESTSDDDNDGKTAPPTMGDKEDISLCAKWAPSLERFHDRHTFIATQIAEIMFPRESFPPLLLDAQPAGLDNDDSGGGGVDLYHRHARESYRRALSALRARLGVVERAVTRGAFADEVRYEEVPSLAMRAYAPLFAERDGERFAEYLAGVKAGKGRISGAVLMPSVLVRDALEGDDAAGCEAVVFGRRKKKERAFDRGKRVRRRGRGGRRRGGRGGAVVMMQVGGDQEQQSGREELEGETLDAQWETLVRRVRESGTLESCIAVCDVSGSMSSPVFSDGTTPMHTAIGLSLLMAEVVDPPFGGAFITFSESPAVQGVDLSRPFREKVWAMRQSHWGMNTDLVAVFEKLILPMAVRNGLTQEQMVKKVFVFSDMQFDMACRAPGRAPQWTTSFERIEEEYRAAGYDMPEVVFWNLAGGRAGYTRVGDPTAPKPATAELKGVAMVSGYSQALLKVFMGGGQFGDEEDGVVTVEGHDGVEVVKKKKKLDPVSLMRRAIGHRAYDMLRVVD